MADRILWRCLSIDGESLSIPITTSKGWLLLWEYWKSVEDQVNYLLKSASRLTCPYPRLAYDYDLCSSYFEFDSDPNSNRYIAGHHLPVGRDVHLFVNEVSQSLLTYLVYLCSLLVDWGKEKEEVWMRRFCSFRRLVYKGSGNSSLSCCQWFCPQLFRSHQ